MQILLATANAHKVKEIHELLEGCDIEVLSLRDFPEVELPEETGASMRDNARLKAEHCTGETGLAALADDSGIEVEALDNAPGVLSARWVGGSDEDRTRVLLKKLKDVPDENRAARYRCAICLAFPDGKMIETEATCEGRIAHEAKGENGFGYDPIFEITAATGAPDEWIGKTMAQAPGEIKACVSHRARALQQLRDKLANESGA